MREPVIAGRNVHTCVIDGPVLPREIAVREGEIVHREGGVFADLLPAS